MVVITHFLLLSPQLLYILKFFLMNQKKEKKILSIKKMCANLMTVHLVLSFFEKIQLKKSSLNCLIRSFILFEKLPIAYKSRAIQLQGSKGGVMAEVLRNNLRVAGSNPHTQSQIYILSYFYSQGYMYKNVLGNDGHLSLDTKTFVLLPFKHL